MSSRHAEYEQTLVSIHEIKLKKKKNCLLPGQLPLELLQVPQTVWREQTLEETNHLPVVFSPMFALLSCPRRIALCV